LFNRFFGTKNALQFLIGLLVGEFLDLALKVLDLIFGTLTNGPLSFTVCNGVSGITYILSQTMRSMGQVSRQEGYRQEKINRNKDDHYSPTA
jgi:hypothetical protein